MKKRTNWLTILMLLLIIISSFGLTSCSRKRKVVTVKDINVTGLWKDYVEIEDGKYRIEVHNGIPRINMQLKVKKTFLDFSENFSSILVLIPATSVGNNIVEADDGFRVESLQKFNEFVRSQAGTTTMISFAAPRLRKNWISKTNGFNAETHNARIVAIPELIGIGDISNDILINFTSAVTTGLIDNKFIHSIVDYNQITAAQRQLMFEASDWSNPGKIAELGRVLNANTIAVGNISVDKGYFLFNTYILSLQLIDINTMSIIGSLNLSNNAKSASSVPKKVSALRLTGIRN
jgi:hypothetical protein